MTLEISVSIVQTRLINDGIVEITCQLNGSKIPFKMGQHVPVTLSSLSFSDTKDISMNDIKIEEFAGY